jgi:hypothetical protein
MALSLQLALLLLAEHRARPFEGPVLTLGRQSFLGSHPEMLGIFVQAGIQPVPLPPEFEAPGKHLYGDQVFFAHLGLESATLDVSDYEEAEIVHDLNTPVAPALHGRYRTVIDGGTFEHVFDVRQAFANMADLVAPGGRVLHISPANNYVNHGFWQLSPRSFFSFYRANGFVDLRATLIVHPRVDDGRQFWATFTHESEHAGDVFTASDDRLTCLFSATKTAASTSGVVPSQDFEAESSGPVPAHIVVALADGDRLRVMRYT